MCARVRVSVNTRWWCKRVRTAACRWARASPVWRAGGAARMSVHGAVWPCSHIGARTWWCKCVCAAACWGAHVFLCWRVHGRTAPCTRSPVSVHACQRCKCACTTTLVCTRVPVLVHTRDGANTHAQPRRCARAPLCRCTRSGANARAQPHVSVHTRPCVGAHVQSCKRTRTATCTSPCRCTHAAVQMPVHSHVSACTHLPVWVRNCANARAARTPPPCARTRVCPLPWQCRGSAGMR